MPRVRDRKFCPVFWKGEHGQWWPLTHLTQTFSVWVLHCWYFYTFLIQWVWMLFFFLSLSSKYCFWDKYSKDYWCLQVCDLFAKNIKVANVQKAEFWRTVQMYWECYHVYYIKPTVESGEVTYNQTHQHFCSKLSEY